MCDTGLAFKGIFLNTTHYSYKMIPVLMKIDSMGHATVQLKQPCLHFLLDRKDVKEPTEQAGQRASLYHKKSVAQMRGPQWTVSHSETGGGGEEGTASLQVPPFSNHRAQGSRLGYGAFQKIIMSFSLNSLLKFKMGSSQAPELPGMFKNARYLSHSFQPLGHL